MNILKMLNLIILHVLVYVHLSSNQVLVRVHVNILVALYVPIDLHIHML